MDDGVPEGDVLGTVRYDSDNDLFVALTEHGWRTYMPGDDEDEGDAYGPLDVRDIVESTIVVGTI